MSLPYRFFLLGVLFALTGMGLGLYMGISEDFTLTGAHAHINLVGWATHFLFGLYYRVEPANAKGRLPEVHFACAALGGILLPTGIIGVLTDRATLAVVVIPGALLTIASMLLFLAVVLRGWRMQAAERAV